MRTKKCNKCNIIKPIENFRKWRNQCKECINKQIREKRKLNTKFKKQKEILSEGLKRCTKCNKIKLLNKFVKGRNQCNDCKKEYRKQQYENNKEKELQRQNQWVKNNPGKVKIIKKRWKDKNPDYDKKYQKKHKEKVSQIKKKWARNNKEKRNQMDRKKYKNNIQYRLKNSMKNMLKNLFYLIGTKKQGRTVDSIGYSSEKLKLRLEVNFTNGMCWKNYGKLENGDYGWEIDHTISKDRFIKRGITNPKIINALSNLKPRWKTNKIIDGIFYLGNIEKSNNKIYAAVNPA